jgi:hypothetical protein
MLPLFLDTLHYEENSCVIGGSKSRFVPRMIQIPLKIPSNPCEEIALGQIGTASRFPAPLCDGDVIFMAQFTFRDQASQIQIIASGLTDEIKETRIVRFRVSFNSLEL